ncbi:MAG TPA: hypothetical protein PLL78_09235 [Fimbriimonadaceae bacterium]|nr:hypothetical protein [Fimbriimonadaceae bacterium]
MQRLIIGAVSGLLSAILVDLNAWARTSDDFGLPDAFSWALAVKRWIAGLVSGAVAALGVGQVLGPEAG